MSAPRNRSLTLSDEDYTIYRKNLLSKAAITSGRSVNKSTIHGESEHILPLLRDKSVHLLIADPPYNLNKSFNGTAFKKSSREDYIDYLEAFISALKSKMHPKGSLYICGDWRSSSAIETVLEKYFIIQNRITFEREKGRGAKNNWKNASEDIWFASCSKDYFFNVEAVKQKRKVIAPYRENGKAKDWQDDGENKTRLTHPSNHWSDITIPFWSMTENTEHPTQKPEKLIAKLILASSRPGDLVLDPFLGSGTTSVVAKKLGRDYIGIEREEKYCIIAEKRLALAENHSTIQGYQDGVFLDRNFSQKASGQ